MCAISTQTFPSSCCASNNLSWFITRVVRIVVFLRAPAKWKFSTGGASTSGESYCFTSYPAAFALPRAGCLAGSGSPPLRPRPLALARAERVAA